MTDPKLTIMRAAHHAYCRDTGCFDGDDIAHPEVEETITKALALAEAKGALDGWGLPGWPHNYTPDSVHNANCHACDEFKKRQAAYARCLAALEEA